MTPVLLLLPPSPSLVGVSEEEATGADEDEAVEEGLALAEGVLEVRWDALLLVVEEAGGTVDELSGTEDEVGGTTELELGTGSLVAGASVELGWVGCSVEEGCSVVGLADVTGGSVVEVGGGASVVVLDTGASVEDEGGAAVVLADEVCCCSDDDSVGADDVGMISDDEVGDGDDDEVVVVVVVGMSDEADIIDWSVAEVLPFAVVLVLTSSGTAAAEEEVGSTC